MVSSGVLVTIRRRGKALARQTSLGLTRGLLAVAAALVAVRTVFPSVMDILPRALMRQEFAAVVLIAVLAAMNERLAALDKKLQGDDPREVANRQVAYVDLADHLESVGITELRLVQFSGGTVLPFIERVATKHPNMSVKLLLFDPELMEPYESEIINGIHDPMYHREKQRSAIRQLSTVAETHPHLHIEYGYYDSNPERSIVLVDHTEYCLGSYRTTIRIIEGRRLLSIRGHEDPVTLSCSGRRSPQRENAKRHFEDLWKAKRVGGVFGGVKIEVQGPPPPDMKVPPREAPQEP